MILEGTVSVTDLILTKTGSIDNLAQFIIDHELENVDQDLSGKDIEVYNRTLTFSEGLRTRKRVISTRDANILDPTLRGAFTEGFDEGFDI